MGMPTKVKVTEDKQELQKQLGCMNGIFQLFDRRYLLGQRRHGHNHMKLVPGQSENGENEFKHASEKPKEKTPNKVPKEKHRASVESSRNSFSSSCSSTTFSSLDYSKRVKTEHSSFSEPSSPTLQKQPDLSVQPPDIWDVVKDSMTRKPRVVSVKPVAKDERRGPAMTHVDSPRPLQNPKTGSYDRKDQNLAKLREISLGGKNVKETSRFSCDGRESPYKLKSFGNIKELPRLSLDGKQNSIKNHTIFGQTGGETKTSIHSLDQTCEPGSNKRPPSGVVARLMGLDNLVGSEDKLVSPRVQTEPASPRRGIDNVVTRIRLEPAPWKQDGSNRSGSQKQPFKNKKASEGAEHGCSSVYGEIEKRLTELEFKTSGKDLRALKQILEAMQRTRMRLENDRGFSNVGSDRRQNQKSVQPVSPTIKKATSTDVKRANLASDSMMITGTRKVMKVNREDGRKVKKVNQSDFRKSTGGTLSPRLQGSRNGINKKSVHGPSSDPIRIRKQSNRQPTTPDLKIKNSRNLCQDRDSVSYPSESNTSVASENEPEVTSTNWIQERDSFYHRDENHKKTIAERLIEYKPMAELAMLTMEQPSPVSVLDAFYVEDPPSPVKKKSYSFNDDQEDLQFDEPEWNQVRIDNLVSTMQLDRSNPKTKIENMKNKVHQFELLSSGNDESTINGDHRYITEILSASGFLKNLDCAATIVHLHPTGSLINPELFHVLEKTKTNSSSKSNEKIRRKMVFDTVNDILVQKLAESAKRNGEVLNGEKLLTELWSEINNLQDNTTGGLYDEIMNITSADVNKKSEDWDEYSNEVPVLVLGIERLIFKDLISEVVSGEAGGLQDGLGHHCRQLFPV